MKTRFQRINFQHLFFDLGLAVISFYASIFLRVSFNEAVFFLPRAHALLPVVILFRLVFFLYFETHNIIWRYVSAVDAYRLAKSVLVSTIFIVATSYIFSFEVLPRTAFVIDAVLLLGLLSSVRLTRRLLHEGVSNRQLQRHGERTLIFGAGATGQGVLKRLVNDRELKLFVVGFIDDDPLKIHTNISGLRVHGGEKDLENILPHLEIKNLVVAIPHPDKELLKRVFDKCSELGIRLLVMNSSLNAGIDQGNPIRQLELQDLLIRPPHKIDLQSTQEMLAGKRILITGAGGSIGSEICRQVLSYGPSRLVLVEHSEFNLFNIDQELKSFANYDVIVPAMVDIKDRESLASLFKLYQPEIVFHAAAYKHVHLVESNPFTAIINNILGTKNVVDLAEENNVTDFVLISTDKAVNPAGVMGSTKRICEMIVSMAGARTQNRYCSVRFGNVLGSSGSLIPLLKKQIEKGEPLTVTHPDVTRYFMLIEEAVALVLKAASISRSGDINVLRMGEPVKILDLAKSLIRLMGKQESEVEIQFTGLRPGEKMFEELYISGNELSTEHPDILVLPKGDALPLDLTYNEISEKINKLISLAQRGQRESLYILGELVNSNYEHPTFVGHMKSIKLPQ